MSITSRVVESVGCAVLAAALAALFIVGLDARELSSATRRLAASQEGAAIAAGLLQVANVRLQAPPLSVPQPSALLTFDLVNDSLLAVTNVTLRVEVHERQPADAVAAQQFIVQPFDVRGGVTIEPGFTMRYELLLRNLDADCGCEATVTVVSASAIGETRTPVATAPRKGE